MENETMALTHENVEKVLDELRPFLMADGGNVEIVEIDGPIVKVRLQGACGSCPSSTMTLKMGIERKLREAIPEVSEDNSPEITEDPLVNKENELSMKKMEN